MLFMDLADTHTTDWPNSYGYTEFVGVAYFLDM